jgi:hypothetical protein
MLPVFWEKKLSITDWSMEVVASGPANTRFFTLAQANRSLVLVRRIVCEVVREYSRLLELEEMIDSAGQAGSEHQLDSARKSLVASVDTLQTCLDELEQIGVELRDFSRGIVDFQHEYQGRVVSLCWLLGEDEILYWHEHGAGFACRQSVKLLEPAELIEAAPAAGS